MKFSRNASKHVMAEPVLPSKRSQIFMQIIKNSNKKCDKYRDNMPLLCKIELKIYFLMHIDSQLLH